MVGLTRRSARRAAEIWSPLREIVDATATWEPTLDDYVVADPALRRGRETPELSPTELAALLNAVHHAALLPEGELEDGAVAYLIPLFVPMKTPKTGGGRGERWTTQVLPLSITVDGRPLWEIGTLPVVRAGTRQTVVLERLPSRHKVLESGSVTVSFGIGPGPAPLLAWTDDDGMERRARVRPGQALPPGAPSWMASVLIDGALAPASARDIEACAAATQELARRAMARLLAQFRTLVAAHLQRQTLRNTEIVRHGGTASTLDDRANDLYEHLVGHVRNYVEKALHDDGDYVRPLVTYVYACFPPALLRSELTYHARTGQQSADGVSRSPSEATLALRRHAMIHRLDDPVTAQAHHAVHWILSRRFRRELITGTLSLDDLQAMWDHDELPHGVRVPALAKWELAIGHTSDHVPLDAGQVDDSGPAARVEAGVAFLTGGVSNRPAELPEEDDLALLTSPFATGFLALTAHVAARLSVEQPAEWRLAASHHRSVSLILRAVTAPFADDGTRARGAAELHRLGTVDGRWRDAAELIALWEDARRDAEGTRESA